MVKGVYRERLLNNNRIALQLAQQGSLLHQVTQKVAYYLSQIGNGDSWRNAQIRVVLWSADKDSGIIFPHGLDLMIGNYNSLDDLSHEVTNNTEH